MLRRLYDWTMRLAERPSAELWLFVISFVESSIFLVPAEVLFLPMAIANPRKVWRYGLIAALGSILGGVAGWMIGYYAFEAIAKPVLEFYGKLDDFETLKSAVSLDLVMLFLVTSGVAHLPPLKVVTILSGVLQVNLLVFFLAAVVARGGKFMLLAWLFARYGSPIRDFIERRLNMLAGSAAVALILAYFLYLALKH
ncbi:YqaA family protein [Rhizobium sp. TRM95796]|uniref:YqaA family protein n=1 Tax=Rhizobium sp. TRM95796 TaxID=2979862 RepID=UPI0021E850D6|nr:YqaA family protein [Rhizobium sp. TRM95796]MCV3767394.1 DedA family protein [Rhizobium sp. TRM95796]